MQMGDRWLSEAPTKVIKCLMGIIVLFYQSKPYNIQVIWAAKSDSENQYEKSFDSDLRFTLLFNK